MARRQIARSFPLLMLAIALMTGCASGDGLDRQPIQGTVALDGQPLADGAVLFEPASNEAGTAVGATIQGGSFAIPRALGPVPGAYRVRIYSASSIQAPPGPGQSPRTSRPMVERIPERYNAQTVLNAQVSNRQANTFRFTLESRGEDETPHAPDRSIGNP